MQRLFCKIPVRDAANIRTMTHTEAPGAEAELHTRRSLVHRLRDLEDRHSWQDFFDTYWKLIYSVARRAGLTEHEAEEVVQETTATVARCIQEFKYDPSVCSFKNWLLHKTRWRIIDQVRKRPRVAVEGFAPAADSSVTPALERIADPESLDLDAVWEAEWQQNLIDAAMARVKRRIEPEHYQIFFLSAVRRLGPRQIARTLAVNVAQVYMVRHRVARLIRQEIRALEQREGERR